MSWAKKQKRNNYTKANNPEPTKEDVAKGMAVMLNVMRNGAETLQKKHGEVPRGDIRIGMANLQIVMHNEAGMEKTARRAIRRGNNHGQR